MTHYPFPKLLVNQTFRDTGFLSKTVGWELDFRQIDHGPLCARAALIGHDDIVVLRVEFDRSFRPQEDTQSGKGRQGLRVDFQPEFAAHPKEC